MASKNLRAWITFFAFSFLSGCASSSLWDRTRLNKSRSPAIVENQRSSQTSGYYRLLAKAHAAEQMNKLDDACRNYELLCKNYPERAEAFHRLGVIADQKRRFVEAQALFTEAIHRDPRNPEIMNDLGYCFFLQGKLEKAESALSKAVKLSPGNARFRNNLGMVYGHRGQYEAALAEFKQVGSEADAQYNLAFVYASQDKMDAARECMQRTLLLEPSHRKARRAIDAFNQAENGSEIPLAVFGEDRNVRWVPYIERGESEGVVQIGATSDTLPSQPISSNRSAGKRTRRLQSRTQHLMNVHMDDAEGKMGQSHQSRSASISG